MSKRESIDELLKATYGAGAAGTRSGVVHQSLHTVSGTASGSRTSEARALPPSIPGVVVASDPSAPLGALSSGSSSSASGSALTNQLQQISTQLTQIQGTNQSAIDTTTQNTQALLQDTLTKSQGGGSSTLGTIGSTLMNVFGGSLSPIITGLTSLFGGGVGSTPQPLTPYVLPQSVQLQGGVTGGNGTVSGVDQNSGGTLRPIPASAQSTPQQVTVQVQALDSQSFLDHSTDIANAVRQALLNGNSLSDVISEL